MIAAVGVIAVVVKIKEDSDMKIIKISVALMLLFLITSDARGYFMENKVKSDTYSVNSLDHTGKVLEVRIPSGNIIIERNGALNVDYYFEYNADNATPAVANEIFGKCKIKFRNNVLTAEYPELQSGWLNAHYNMTVPQDVSLKIYLGAGKVSVMGIGLADVAVEVDSGKITFDNVQIAGAARLLLSSGNIRVANSKVGGDGLLSVGSGKITLQRPEFKKDSSVIVQKGKIHWFFSPHYGVPQIRIFPANEKKQQKE